jgi:hypothetical protein
MDDEVRDPDLDDLPRELDAHPGPWRIAGVDPDTGVTFSAPVSREQVASAFADQRRREEDDDDV